jgi:sodium/potassium-transporting ATPase subunit beta
MVIQEEKKKLNFCQKLANTCRGFGNFLYSKRDVNGVEQTLVMGRNGSSWAKIGLFYICFYAFLAGFFAAMLAVFLSTIQEPGKGPPKLTQFIANKPGLTIVNEVLSGYKVADDATLEGFQKKVDAFLNGYTAKGYSDTYCLRANKTGYPEGEKPCKFNTAFLKDYNCTKETFYGLKQSKPCFL